ncbi:MAG: TonB-dependent receptor [Mariniphaga sp.]|nr:TonB-dependent receptor [Mariniphaga sp.]
MKKNHEWWAHNRYALKKSLTIMKWSLFFIFIGCIQAFAVEATYAQKTKLELNFSQTNLEKVLNEIETQSEFFFLFNQDQINTSRKVDIQVKGAMIQEVLNDLFAGTDVKYTIIDRQIVLTNSSELLNQVNQGAQQQGKKVTGKVTDSAGASLPGVSVVVKGTTTGVVTDNNGSYSLQNVQANATLQFSFVGMKMKEITVGAQTSINVSLAEEAIGIEEVVAIGYGKTTKKEITGSISSVKDENFNKVGSNDPMSLIQGQVAGLNITKPSHGDPNSGYTVNLRGLTSLSGGQSPLFVIDGISGASLESISPEEIESIDVLKDGSAAAIYGTRGTNGVIIITTKKAKRGETKVEYSSSFKTETIKKQLDILSSSDYREKLKEYNYSPSLDKGANTNWFDEVTRKPFSQIQSVSISGGSEKLLARASVNYENQQGIVKKSSNEKLTSRVNIIYHGLNDRLLLDYVMLYSTKKADVINYKVMEYAALYNPTAPIYNPDGSYYKEDLIDYYDNPVNLLNGATNEKKTNNFSGSLKASFDITKDLKISGNAIYQKSNDNQGYYEESGYQLRGHRDLSGYAFVYNSLNENRQFEGTVSYNKVFKKHSVQAIGGYTYNENYFESMNIGNYGFWTDLFAYNNIGAGDALNNNKLGNIGSYGNGSAGIGTYASENKLIGAFGRLMYNYDEKYLLNVSLRREGSSKFGENNKWGTFPAISVGWRINRENFLKDNSIINDLKLRIGYGVTGNQDIGEYNSIAKVSRSTVVFGGKPVDSYGYLTNSNPNLKWEKKTEYNIGIDASLLNNRLSGSVDVYRRDITDLLWRFNVPQVGGKYKSPSYLGNYGSYQTSGIELALNAVPFRTNIFKWNTTFLFSHSTNILKKISSEDNPATFLNDPYRFIYDRPQTWAQKIKEGSPIGNWYALRFLGEDEKGKAIYDDINADGKINDEDRYIVGNSLPKFLISFSNNFAYKNFDLAFSLRGSFGNYILNRKRIWMEELSQFELGYNVFTTAFEAPGNRATEAYDDRFLEKGDFVKLDVLTFGYNFKTHSKTAFRVYLTGQNLFTITSYTGLDPEVNTSGIWPGGDQGTYYPTTRSFILGVNIKF